jgi:alkanesulfonate monooxygenase SsuD/methylene tetrahydromethanopterin reductase-like flavin-dependent oxidoreductase (luciferase family)
MGGWRAGVLDFCDVAGAGTRMDGTLALAQRAEALGYAAFWLAEHYTGGVGHANAPMAAIPVAGTTDKLRVGPAGMMMRYTQPLYAANMWSLLADLFPERIDFGLSMGAATGPYEALMAYGMDAATQDPLKRMEATAALLSREAAVPLIPPRREDPNLWFLGSSARSATSAAAHGARYCLSLTHGPKPPPAESAAAYLDHVAPRPGCTPELAILVGGVCLPDAARRDAAVARALASWSTQHLLAGDAAYWKDTLAELGERYRTRNVIFRDVCGVLDDRLESLELFARAAS